MSGRRQQQRVERGRGGRQPRRRTSNRRAAAATKIGYDDDTKPRKRARQHSRQQGQGGGAPSAACSGSTSPTVVSISGAAALTPSAQHPTQRQSTAASAVATCPPRFQTQRRTRTTLHNAIVMGDWAAVHTRLRTHPQESIAVDSNGDTPLDYGVTMEVPREVLKDILRTPPVSTAAAVASIETTCKEGQRGGERRVENRLISAPQVYNDAGLLTIHRACQNNIGLKTLTVLLERSPETSLATTAPMGVVRRWRQDMNQRKGGRERFGRQNNDKNFEDVRDGDKGVLYCWEEERRPKDDTSGSRGGDDATSVASKAGSRAPVMQSSPDDAHRRNWPAPTISPVSRTASLFGKLAGPSSEDLSRLNNCNLSQGSPRQLTQKQAIAEKLVEEPSRPPYGSYDPLAASGPLCSDPFMPGHPMHPDERTILTPLDCVWINRGDLSAEARRLFTDSNITGLVGKATKGESIESLRAVDQMEEAEREILGDMWNRLSLVLKTAWLYYHRRGDDDVASVVDSIGKSPGQSSFSTSSSPRLTVTTSTSSTSSSPSTPMSSAAITPSTSRLITPSSTPTMDLSTWGTPTYPVLHAALAEESIPLEIIEFVVRMFPDELRRPHPDSGDLAVHVVCRGGCRPRRWGWSSKGVNRMANPVANTMTYRIAAGASAAAAAVAAGEEGMERGRGTMLLPLLIQAWPGAARVPDVCGRLPIHLALEVGFRYHRPVSTVGVDCEAVEAGESPGDVNNVSISDDRYETGILPLLDAYPDSISVRDPMTGLYPCMLAAASAGNDVSDLNTVFELLLRSPEKVQGGIQ